MKSSTTLSSLILSTESTTKDRFHFDDIPRRRASRASHVSKGIENAIYAHIRAIRALGRTAINTRELASALSLSIGEVNRAISSLKKKGVKY
jgi:hypothetical protein